MKPNLEFIENYLTGQLPPDERTRFETTLRDDPDVAEAVAFYLLTRQTAQQESREQRRAELDALRTANSPLRPRWSAPMRWAAAASVVVFLGLGWNFFRPASSANQLADDYIAAHFNELPTTMDAASSGSGAIDSVRTGAGLFNDGKLTEADFWFRGVLAHHPNEDSALKYAGIVALRQGNYDQAIELFHRLSRLTDLVGNPGTFYEALAHLKRNQPLDKEQARKLLDEVINRNLDRKQEAGALLNQL